MPNIEAPWAKVPLALLEEPTITLADIKTYAAIDFLAGKRGWWYGSHKMVAARAGTSQRASERSTVKLVELGFLASKRLGMKFRTWTQYWVVARTTKGPNEPTEEVWDHDSVGEPDPPALADPIPQTSTTEDDERRNSRSLYDTLVSELQAAPLPVVPDRYWAAFSGKFEVQSRAGLITAVKTIDAARGVERTKKTRIVLPGSISGLEKAGFFFDSLEARVEPWMISEVLWAMWEEHPTFQPGIAMENALLIVAQFPDEFIARCRGLAWRYDEGS